MAPDPADGTQPTGTQNTDGGDVILDTSEVSRAAQKVDLDLDDAPFLEEEEEVAPEPPKPKEAVTLTAEEKEAPPPRDKKKLIIIGAGALVLVLALGLAAKFLFFKGKSAPPPDTAAKQAEPAKKAEAPPPPKPEIEVRMDPFWVEQKAEGEEVRFLIVRIALITHDEKVAKEFQARVLAARNAIFYFLKNKDLRFLSDEKNAEALKAALLPVANQFVSDGKFETLLFEEYVVK